MKVCSLQTEKVCRTLTSDQPAIIVQRGTHRHYYHGAVSEAGIVEFIDLLRDSADMELSESQVMEIMDPSSREHTWLLAFLPARCGRVCEALLHQWRLFSKRLRPLEFVRVGALQCTGAEGLCNNVRTPTARLYPIASGHHYTVNLQHLSQAPYMSEWALEHIDDSVQKLNWQSFNRLVLSEELNPTR
ncbi:hypothetical protein NE865_07655 [Phthorimaea operculella]|nr:hypothetical protein NE865_07655 [Phthorimaea operculella]